MPSSHAGNAARSTSAAPAAAAPGPLVVEIAGLRQMLVRAGRLFAEAVLVPSALLMVLMHTVGLTSGLIAAMSWCFFAVGVRWLFGRQLPGTLLVCACAASGKACVALAASSAFVYLLQPALGSALMAAVFVGSVLLGRPITMRLARDFVSLPEGLVHRHGVRRMFTEVALLWGLSRAADAAMSMGFLRLGVDAGMLSRAVLSPTLTLVTVAICTAWGVRSLRRLGIRVRLVPARAAA